MLSPGLNWTLLKRFVACAESRQGANEAAVCRFFYGIQTGAPSEAVALAEHALLRAQQGEESPNGRPLLVVASEVSGLTTVYEIAEADRAGGRLP